MTLFGFLRDWFPGVPFDTIFFGNTLLAYVESAFLFVAALIVFAVVQGVVLSRLGRLAATTQTDVDDVAINVIRSIRPPFYLFLAFYIALLPLTLNGIAQQVIDGILIAWIVYQVVIALHILIDYVLLRKSRAEGKDGKAAYSFISNFIKWSLWIVGILLVLSNLGVNITSLVAGLGIGGLAIAFAVQNILEDLFSSFAIHFDKPFEIGDFVIVGEHLGTVEKIGIKSTRIRALQGEEIVISNKELTSARIQNFRKLNERRIVFGFGILYETPRTTVEKVPALVERVIADIATARFDRAHFKSFGDSSLDFEVVYYVDSNDYAVYMDTQQAINLALMQLFEQEGIEFAYPTRTVYVKK